MNMYAPTLPHVAGWSFANIAERVFPYFSRKSSNNQTEEGMQKDLRRLAELSPHLLADLGFVQDRKASTPGRQVWRKGEHSVTLHITTDRVAVQAPTARITPLQRRVGNLPTIPSQQDGQ